MQPAPLRVSTVCPLAFYIEITVPYRVLINSPRIILCSNQHLRGPVIVVSVVVGVVMAMLCDTGRPTVHLLPRLGSVFTAVFTLGALTGRGDRSRDQDSQLGKFFCLLPAARVPDKAGASKLSCSWRLNDDLVSGCTVADSDCHGCGVRECNSLPCCTQPTATAARCQVALADWPVLPGHPTSAALKCRRLLPRSNYWWTC